MFQMEDNTSKLLYHMIDPWIIDALSEEEKQIAQGRLMAALDRSFDRRWLWGLGELRTAESYDFVWGLFEKETVHTMKVKYAKTLIWMNKDSPVLEYIQEILKSDEIEDVRMEALSTLYPLYDKEFESQDRHQLYLTILFNTMKDESKRLRTYAYDMLKDHYEMKEYTPIDDEILTILSTGQSREDYERASRLFEERIESIEIVPFSRQVISQWVDSRPDNPPSIDLASCEICSEIPDTAAADMTVGESLDAYTSKLETVIRFAYYKNCVLRCPTCGRFYLYKYEYEYLIPRSEEDEYLERTDIVNVIAFVDSFIKFYDFKKVITCGNFLKLSY